MLPALIIQEPNGSLKDLISWRLFYNSLDGLGTCIIFANEIIESTMLSIKEVSLKLSISPQQVRNLCRDGKLESEKVGRTWVISEESVTEYCSTSAQEWLKINYSMVLER